MLVPLPAILLTSVLSLAGGAAQAVQVPPRPPVERPPCPVSDDGTFGFSLEKPIRVGGGAAYVADRERRYLLGLRGPAGETLTFQRSGSTRSPKLAAPVDVYQIRYDGLTDPITLYVDAYHYEEPKAPRGFTCVGFTLGAPPVDPFMATDAMVRLAIEQGATRDFAPISLDPDGSSLHGVAIDRFRAIALASKAASAGGKPIDPANPPRDLPAAGLTLFGYPIKCGDRTVSPTSIEILPPQGVPVRMNGELTTGEAAARLVREFAPPAGAVGAKFQLGMLRAGDRVVITYADDACDVASKDVRLPVRFVAAKAASLPVPAMPPGMAADTPPVLLQVVIDVDGKFQVPNYIGGPEELFDPSKTVILGWRADPARVNNTPIIADTLLLVRFK